VPAPYVPPPHTADQILARARQNLRPAPAPVPYQPPITPAALAAARQNLTPTAATADPAARLLPQGWSFGLPTVVPLSEQTKGKTLGEMIQPTHSALLYMNAAGQLLNANTVLSAGVHQIRSRWVANGRMGPITLTTLHVKPTIDEVMTAMGFAFRGNWRWELAWGAHGTLHRNFHLTVPEILQTMPERMDNPGDIFRGLFPLGQGTTGTHMTIECRPTPGQSNAAYFLNGTRKNPQGFTPSEGEQFVNACRTRLHNWNQQALTSLRNALATL
jgi:hypothetical protein